jgi:hypothetical protein
MQTIGGRCGCASSAATARDMPDLVSRGAWPNRALAILYHFDRMFSHACITDTSELNLYGHHHTSQTSGRGGFSPFQEGPKIGLNRQSLRPELRFG